MIAFILTNPWRAATIALCGLAAALLVQIHGLPLIGGGLLSDLSAERTAHVETQKRYAQAQLDAAAEARAYRLSEEARYRAKAERTDNEHAKELSGALAAADRHIAANRCLRTETPASAGGGTGTSATGDGAEFRQEMPTDTFVAIASDDLRSCTSWVAYGISARKFILGLDEGR